MEVLYLYFFDKISTSARPDMSPDQQNIFKDRFSLSNLADPSLHQASFAQHHSTFICSTVCTMSYALPFIAPSVRDPTTALTLMTSSLFTPVLFICNSM